MAAACPDRLSFVPTRAMPSSFAQPMSTRAHVTDASSTAMGTTTPTLPLSTTGPKIRLFTAGRSMPNNVTANVAATIIT